MLFIFFEAEGLCFVENSVPLIPLLKQLNTILVLKRKQDCSLTIPAKYAIRAIFMERNHNPVFSHEVSVVPKHIN